MQTPMERWVGETATDQPWQGLAEVHYGKDPSVNMLRYPQGAQLLPATAVGAGLVNVNGPMGTTGASGRTRR
jgi:hypothetical protein